MLLVDKQLIQAEKVYDFNQKLDLPTSLMNLGIKDVKQIIDLILQDKMFCEQAMDIHYLEKHLLKQLAAQTEIA